MQNCLFRTVSTDSESLQSMQGRVSSLAGIFAMNIAMELVKYKKEEKVAERAGLDNADPRAASPV